MRRPEAPAGEPEAEAAVGLAEALLVWYRAGHRDLPWRRTRDPYAIWVSEIMLQQTQAATVVPYYERFLARFPTVEALAEASTDEVMRLWAGLGYYSRARNLQQGAREVVARHGGRVPATVEELLRLPGVGRYTAGAVASIAYGEPAPILDGNVIRVLCRLFAPRGDPKRSPLQGRLWELAGELIPRGEAGDFNQALMELGATVCTPASPRCEVCPVAARCEARRLGIQEALPELPRAAPPTLLRMAAAVIWRGSELLLVKRPAGQPVAEEGATRVRESGSGWWVGMWQLPSGELQPGESTAEAAARLARETVGLQVTPGPVAGVVRHGVTRFKVTLEGRHCVLEGEEPRAVGCAEWVWTRPEEAERFALPAPQQRLVEQIRRQREGGQLALLEF